MAVEVGEGVEEEGEVVLVAVGEAEEEVGEGAVAVMEATVTAAEGTAVGEEEEEAVVSYLHRKKKCNHLIAIYV